MKNNKIEKKRFYVYASWEESMDLLSVEEKATMLMNLFKYQKGEEPILDTTGLKMIWASIKFLLEKDNQTYMTKVETAQENSQSRKAIKDDMVSKLNDMVDKTTISYHMVPSHTISSDNVNVNVNVNGDDNGGDNERELLVNSIIESIDNGMTSYKQIKSKYPRLNLDPELSNCIQEYLFSIK